MKINNQRPDLVRQSHAMFSLVLRNIVCSPWLMKSEGASATYRGYRRQALYVLSRVLLDKAEQGYRPEGAEDLFVYDARGTLVEAIQVKDYTADLAVSHFEPNKAKSFFYRVYERLATAPTAQNRLISFGPLGPELMNCLGPAASNIHRPAKKLTEYHADAFAKKAEVPVLTQTDAEKILRAVVAETASDDQLTARILSAGHGRK